MKQMPVLSFLAKTGRPACFGDFAHLPLVQVAQGEQGFRKLGLVEAVEKIALVLGAVFRFQQLECAEAFPHPRIVAGGDLVRAQGQGVVEEGLELDFGIAQHVRVGRAAGLVFLQEQREYPFLVFLGEIDGFHLDADLVGDRQHVHEILLGRAVAVLAVVVFPVLHEQADHFMALLLQEQGGNGRVHSARHADDNFYS